MKFLFLKKAYNDDFMYYFGLKGYNSFQNEDNFLLYFEEAETHDNEGNFFVDTQHEGTKIIYFNFLKNIMFWS